MKKSCLLCLCMVLILLWLIKISNCAILPTWNDESTYHPIPMVFVHGMNSSPEAWGYLIDPETGKIFIYGETALKLYQYFDEYLAQNPITKAPLIYLEPFNYEFNTFDSIQWNAWEGYDSTDRQYPDGRISLARRFNSPTLRRYIHKLPEVPTDPLGGILSKYQTDKIQLVAHSLGGVVSRYYLHNTKSGGANVLQLTTLGSPHKGASVATVAHDIICEPLTDVHNFGVKKMIWVITLHGILDKVTVGRYPAMIDEVQRFSAFMDDLNKPRNIPIGVRHYCIADVLSPCGWLSWLPLSLTDGFIELDSALGVSPTEQLPCPDLEGYKPDGYLPKYKGKLLTGKENWHIKLTNNAGEILKAIDDTKPVIEVTEVKDTQNKVIWRVGQWPDYFVVPTDGRVKVYGLCRKEYLPADTSINIGFRKAGQTDVNWITESGGTTPDQTQARQWLLQPSNLWIASNTDSPVAEFEVEIDFPLQEVTHSIVVQATNPAGIKSDPVEVVEKTHYIYAVGKDEDGGAKFLCLDGPTSFIDGVGAVVSEFNLVDEAGNKISARPLDVTTDSRTIGTTIWANTIWVGFDNNKIYCYDIATMKPKQLTGGQYYYTTIGNPDGLYYDGSGLQYCSSGTNKIYRIGSTGVETNLEIVSRRLSLDGVATDNTSVNYTTQEYTGYNPTCISTNYLCSLGKISKRGGNNNLMQTLPTNTPIWTNEQDTPGSCLGIVEVTDSSVPGGRAIYYSSTDGNIYKVRFKDKVVISRPIVNAGTVSISSWGYLYAAGGEYIGRDDIWWGGSNIERIIYRNYSRVQTVPEFIEARAISRMSYVNLMIFNGVSQVSSFPMASDMVSTCLFDVSWSNEAKFNAPILSPLWEHQYDRSGITPFGETSPVVKVTDVTEITPTGTGYIYLADRYTNEGQIFPLNSSLSRVVHVYSTEDRAWAFLTDNGTLETQDQFSMPTTIAEGIAAGPRVKIRIEPEFLLLNVGISREFKVNGKGPYIWESGDETVVEIEGIIPQINGVGEVVSIKAVGIGVATITARDALGNIAYANVDVRE